MVSPIYIVSWMCSVYLYETLATGSQEVSGVQFDTRQCLADSSVTVSLDTASSSEFSLAVLPPSVQVLSTAFRLDCSGYVITWGTAVGGVGENIIEFQIWRESSTDNFVKIGSNAFFYQSLTAEGSLRFFAVDEGSMIHAEKGDIVGLYVGGLGTSSLLIVENTNASVHVLYNVSEPIGNIVTDSSSFPGDIETFAPGIGIRVGKCYYLMLVAGKHC